MTSDYGGMRAIVEEARLLDDTNRDRALVDCPRCGTPLERRTDGRGDCPMGHFTTDAQTEGERSHY